MVGGAAAVLRDPVDYDYESPPERREPISARVPKSLKQRLLEIVRLWKIQAQIRNEDPELVDFSHVAERLLKTGADGVWTRMRAATGIEKLPPSTDAEWASLEKAMRAASHQERSK